MKTILLLIFIPIILFSNELTQRHILLLNSYNQSMTWVKDITQSVYDTLEPSKNNFIIHIENMDTKRIYNKKYLEQLKKIYKNKYKDIHFDLILSSDNNAFDFLKENRDEIFGNIPVSFSGVNFFSDSDLDGYDNYTGITEEFDALKTLNIALKLKPNTKEIFVINDYLKSGIAWKKSIQRQLINFNKNVKIRYVDNISIKELKKQISTLSSDTIILIGAYFKDSNGVYFTYEKIGEILSHNSKVPVFCLLEFNLNEGVVGGNVIGGYYQGEAMSKIGLQILNGTPLSKLKVQKTGATKNIFDYNELEKYNINMSLLPEDSIILNKPASFFKVHKTVILISLLIISILIILIVILLVNIKRRKILEIKLKSEKNYLIEAKEEINKQLEFQQILIDSVNAPIYYKNKDLVFIGCNKAFESFFNKEKKDIIGKNTYDFFPVEIAEKFVKKEYELIKNLTTQEYEEVLILPNNKKVNLKFYKNVYYDKNKNIAGFVGTFFDITELKKVTNELNEVNKNLELKIDERTKELHNTIENLKNTQEQLIESEKMANLGELVSGVAHEINTPIGVSLTGITHLLDITNEIEKKYHSDNMTQEKFEEYLKISQEVSSSINLNLNRTAQLIKSFKQVAVDRESEIKRKFNLKNYIDEILLSINNIIKKTNIKLNIECADNIEINSYPGAFSQVITNLITNSIRHAYKNDEHGKISISVLKEENNIVLTYNDDGCGIPKENLNKIFVPFFTTNRENGGTGLGLSIIYNIITKNLDGSIICTSEESVGTTFKIVIPFK